MYIYKNGSITKKVFFVFDEAKSQEKAYFVNNLRFMAQFRQELGKTRAFL